MKETFTLGSEVKANQESVKIKVLGENGRVVATGKEREKLRIRTGRPEKGERIGRKPRQIRQR